MPAQKPIVDLDFNPDSYRDDVQGILKCLWAIKDGPRDQFMAYGESWIEKTVKQKVNEGVMQTLKDDSTFKKSEVFKEAYVKYGGDMQKIMKAMDISDRTYFRHKKKFIDTETKKDIRKKKYSHHLPLEGVPEERGGGREGGKPQADIEIISLYKYKSKL